MTENPYGDKNKDLVPKHKPGTKEKEDTSLHKKIQQLLREKGDLLDRIDELTRENEALKKGSKR